ncbi:hypothetical protein E3P81_01788 [Wallemia ichthyophaga]|nr:hypothetical protein E3P97_01787 [Wallemia ichthyophaga]TIB33265.1 hypothetical protein E3P85_01441 [Wallemia ichthyophaga]TIB47283.1 hypothetical protein E3P82_01787 [Wallemia ichthyophaga]TIB51612.1 hypothetical protein E3P81_01788 [Wallemia ichthyophaga]TIB54316.1 hypothetical protein E3P80_01788 [Wallemia ichthyophaga]
MDCVLDAYKREISIELNEIKNNFIFKINVDLASYSLSYSSKLLISLSTTHKHVFKNGDLAAIVDTKNAELFRGVVYSSTTDNITISIDRDELDLPSPIYLVKLQDESTYNRLLHTISIYQKIFTSNTQSPLINTIFGLSKPTFCQTPPALYLDKSLNDSQKRAVDRCISADHLSLIHGPPGTGKSYTLIEIIRQLITQNKRILVCGASNLAVDNILERLSAHNIPVTRLGHPARILHSLQPHTLEYQTSHSHQNDIVNDVKKELEDLMKDLKDGRIKGKLKRKNAWNEVRELRKEHRKRSAGVLNNLITRAQVVLCTLHGAGGRQLHNKHFDVCIIDESTQALEPSCLIPVLKANKLILAGDPLQLPPTVLAQPGKKKKEVPKIIPKDGAKKAEEGANGGKDTQEATAALSKTSISSHSPPTQPTLKPLASLNQTLFERLVGIHGNRIKTLLSEQYRMNDLIMRYPSESMYGGALTAHSSVSHHTLLDLPSVQAHEGAHDEIELNSPLVLLDTDGLDYMERVDSEEMKKGEEEGSKYNENEVEVVREKVGQLVSQGVLDTQIAIITPYQAQVGHLKNALRGTYPGCEIGSVDGVQGREEEVVIMSLVRSNDAGEVGFLKEERRLNVAMTRAKRQLVGVLIFFFIWPGADFALQIVVGNSATIRRGSTYLKKWMDFLEEHADIQVPE